MLRVYTDSIMKRFFFFFSELALKLVILLGLLSALDTVCECIATTCVFFSSSFFFPTILSRELFTLPREVWG